MSVTIGDVTFDHVEYDADADVLYLHVGDPRRAVAFDESPEGHALRFDADARLVGVTIVAVRQIVESGQHLIVTVPARIEVEPDQLGAVFNAA
jgi:uncharacterized protein YuzE